MGRARLGRWALPLALATVLGALSLLPYLYAWSAQPAGREFMGFFFLGDDANTYLAKMREGWEGSWWWTNRYSSEPGTGAFFFVFWLFLGHVAALLHLSLMATFHAARVAGAFLLLGAAWLFFEDFVPQPRARRWALWFYAVGLGCGYVIQALHHPVVLGQQTDTLDWRMPELSAFYSILALPHFAWAAAFQALACVFTLRAAERSSLRYGVLAGLCWLAESLIHAQMPILLGGAFVVALLVRRVSVRGYAAAALAFAIAGPYVIYSYWASLHVPEIVRWSEQWRNNLPPDGLSLGLALLPQLLLTALALPMLWRRRPWRRSDVVLVGWLLLLAAILWLPNPAGNLRRRFFDGISLPLVALSAQAMYEVVLPRLRGRAARLVPFGIVAFAAMGSAFLLFAPMLFATNPTYSLTSDEVGALGWLDAHPQGVVLSTGHLGLYVPAYSSDTAYVGQYSETYNIFAKERDAEQLLSGQGDVTAYAHDHGIRYVVWTADVKSGLPAGLGTPVYDTPNAKIWVVPAA